MNRVCDFRKQRGQGMVEFAIVFPLLLLLVFGIFEFGRLMFSYSAAIAASREAARYGAAIQDIGGISQYEDCTGIREAAKRIGKFAGITDSDITIQYSDASGVYSTSCPPAQEVDLADKISVTVNAELTPFTPIGSFSSIPVKSSASRTILKSVKMGSSGTGAGSIQGAVTDVNFKTTLQHAEETAGTITVDVVLNQATSADVTVPFSVTGTAVKGAGQDYTMTASPVIIPAGQTTATISIHLNSDGLEESDESIILGLNTPTNATQGPQDIHTVIVRDPPEVEFTLASSAKSEGMHTVGIMVELSKGSNQDVTVPITTSGSADWGEYGDYTYSPSSVVIPSGSLSSTLMVTINDDAIDEEDEDVLLQMGTPTNALLGDQTQHTLTIQDNDHPPQATFNVGSQVVSEEIGTYFTTITLSRVSGKDVEIPFTAGGTVTAGDYSIITPSPLVIPAGSKTASIEIYIAEGDGYEEDETLELNLGQPINADLGTPGTQQVVITEDTPEPTVYFTSVSTRVIEGNTYLYIGVDLSNAWFQDIDVNYTIGGTAQQGSTEDYVIDPSPLIIPSGRSHGDILVQVREDEQFEGDEQVVLTLESAAERDGSLAFSLESPQTHTLTIEDDDAAPRVSFNASGQTAQEAGGSVSVTASLSNSASTDVTIPLNYSGTAASGSDYTVAATDLIIPAGSTQGTFSVGILDDAEYDPDEQVIIQMGSPTNAELGGLTSHTVSIEDNELNPCQVGTHLITVGTSSITWSLVNDGGTVEFTGGSVSWPKASGISPQLTSISFAGSEVFSGSVKPGTLSYPAAVNFTSLATEELAVQYDSSLGSGTHTLTANFESPTTGETCTVSVDYSNP